MICSKCRTQNLDNAQFCKRCGANLFTIKEYIYSKTPDTLIMTFIILMLGLEVIRLLIQELFLNWYEPPTQYILVGISIIRGFAFVLLALAIKKETTRTTGIILALIYAFYILYLNIQWFIGIN